MNEAAGKHIGAGLGWLGFWLMIGLANFGEDTITTNIKVSGEEEIKDSAIVKYIDKHTDWIKLKP